MEYVEYFYGYPQYESYNGVCHSTKCMFPVSLVLGDLYLLKGDDESCKKAAQSYYDFLSYKYGGPIYVNSYYSTGNWTEGEDEPYYLYVGNPFGETGALSRYNESITCIPSNRGKLDGKVNVSVSRLFGFNATMRATGSGDQTSSSIGLSLSDDRELMPSKQYEALCDSVPYEIYIGPATDQLEVQTYPGIGDTRQSWINNSATGQSFTFRVGEDTKYGKFVTKQNPGRGFTATYPMVYRKATIWLRYAEALNRAGFPSYAFAILQKGLCNNDDWYPEQPATFTPSTDTLWMSNNDFVKAYTHTGEDYAIKDTMWVYVDTVIYKYNEDSTLIEKVAVIAPAASTVSQQDVIDQMQAKKDAGTIDTFYTARLNYVAKSYNNYPDETTQAICYFLDRREVVKAASTPYLNFKTEYLKGNTASYSVSWKMDMLNRQTHSDRTGYIGSTNPDDNVTVGIHSRGAGRLRYDERNSKFNYVDMVTKKVKENHNVTLTKEDIYSGTYDDFVKEAVEDIIIDEMGMELAFEGTRFFDLSRVALRRNDPTYLAKRVAMRNGTMDMTFYNYLSQPKNWYLPLPE
ncbi:MAG: RagB/SusD family nutrient uptake outer membrane protein [Bacteroidaceae bacterium]|nr:RagB/SusD family nutrient uptake outer membrane protein [Bacteroidaceae bacterium]